MGIVAVSILIKNNIMEDISTSEIQEIWKDVVGYEGYYQVSNLGNVKSCERVIKNIRIKYCQERYL